MKNYLKILTLSLLVFTQGCIVRKNVVTDVKNDQLKILSYNIHHANPPSKKEVIDIDAIANIINNSKADIIALQEVDKNTIRSGHIDEAEMIAQKTKLNYIFFKAIDYDGGDYGLAILSRFPLKNEKLIHLPQKIEAEKRILAYTTIKIAGKELTFANTHLDASRSNENRNLQMQYILTTFEKVKTPVILCGDLNNVAGSQAINLLETQFKRTCVNNCPGTVPQINPYRTIDYIATKNVAWPLISYEVIPETYASDHRPISAVFKIQ